MVLICVCSFYCFSIHNMPHFQTKLIVLLQLGINSLMFAFLAIFPIVIPLQLKAMGDMCILVYMQSWDLHINLGCRVCSCVFSKWDLEYCISLMVHEGSCQTVSGPDSGRAGCDQAARINRIQQLRERQSCEWQSRERQSCKFLTESKWCDRRIIYHTNSEVIHDISVYRQRLTVSN